MPLERAEIIVPARGAVDLRATVLCRGHLALPPWRWRDGAVPRLERPEALPDGSVYLLRIRSHPRGVVLRVIGRDARQIEVLAPLAVRVRRALCLETDPSAFRRHCRRDPLLRQTGQLRLGRLLRAPTAFEDLVRLLAGSATPGPVEDRAVAGLLRLGRRCPADPRLRAFPSPVELARLPLAVLRTRTGLGREASGVRTLARRVARGSLDVRLLDDLPRAAAERLLATIPGLTPGARSRMLLLLGHADTIALDRRSRASLRVVVGGDARRLAGWVSRQRPWAGLAAWSVAMLAAPNVAPTRPAVRPTRGAPASRADRS